jgi:preprotein translocase subunit SecB
VAGTGNKRKEKNLDLRTIGKVAAKVEIKSINLIESKTSTVLDDASQPNNNLILSVGIKTCTKKTSYGFEAIIGFELKGKGDKSDIALLNIEANFRLKYELKNKKAFSKKDLDEFAAVNGVYNVWPYWREFVQNTVARMGLPLLTVPVLKVPEDLI